MDDKIVLICATGRSGSTSMQRILNTIPNSNICGENLGAINSLLEFYRRIKESSSQKIPGRLRPASYEDILSQNIKPAWYNSYNYAQIVHIIKMAIVNMFKKNDSNDLWGFKEIRYDSGNISYMKDFKELFPQTKVIIQIRENILAQSNSGWHKNDKNAIPFLKNNSRQLLKFYSENKDWCYLTSFERMFNRNNLRNMFYFIGCGEKFDLAKVDEVLKNNIKD